MYNKGKRGNAMLEKDFARLANNISIAYTRNLIDEVYIHIQDAKERFPEKQLEIAFWTSCYHVRNKQYKDAIAVLEKAIQEGYWFNPNHLMNAKDLESIQKFPEFISIVKTCSDYLQKTKGTSSYSTYLVGDVNSDTAIFALHWRCANSIDFSQYWLGDCKEETNYFAFPQSSQPHSFGYFLWDDRLLAKRESAIMLDAFNQKRSKDSRLIVAGASQDAMVIMEMLFSESINDCSGMIAVMPAIKEWEPIERLVLQCRSKYKIVLIIGKEDPFYLENKKFANLLEERDFPLLFIEEEGLEHSFSDALPQYLKKAITFSIGE